MKQNEKQTKTPVLTGCFCVYTCYLYLLKVAGYANSKSVGKFKNVNIERKELLNVRTPFARVVADGAARIGTLGNSLAGQFPRLRKFGKPEIIQTS
jgi:hypothetical protein